MYNGLITACDNCANPLQGRVGTAIKKCDYIEVTGNILSIIHSKENPDGKTYWAKKKDDFQHLHFCRLTKEGKISTCLSEYLAGKIQLIDEIRERSALGDKGEFKW